MPHLMKSINVLHRAQALYRTRMIDEGLLASHHTFIFAICSEPGRTQDELADALYLNKSTVARVIGALEERGLVRREANPRDKRQLRVYPTEAMLELRPRVGEIAREWNAQLCRGIEEGELDTFLRVLSKMEQNAAEAVKRGGGVE